MRSGTVVWIAVVASTLLILPSASAGVVLRRSSGTAECLPGKTWGYSGDVIWVSDGCSGEFLLGQLATSPTTAPAPYLNQLPAQQKFIDHLGFQHDVNTRNDIFSHRIMIFFTCQQFVRLLRWRPEGHNHRGSLVDIFLTMEVCNR